MKWVGGRPPGAAGKQEMVNAPSASRAESRAVMEGPLDTGGMEGVPSSSEARALDSAHTPGNHIHSLTSFSLCTRSTPNTDPTGSESAFHNSVSPPSMAPAPHRHMGQCLQVALVATTWKSGCY